MPKPQLSPELKREIIRRVNAGERQCDVARSLGLVVHRVNSVIYVYRNPDHAKNYYQENRERWHYYNRRDNKHVIRPTDWSEHKLTEPWVEYTARKKAEREAKRNESGT